MSLYADLGVDKAADAATIKKTYREKAKGMHPDAGGDPESFRQIARAYDILSDDKRRRRYDATGETDRESTGEAYAMAAGAFFDLALAGSVDIKRDIKRGIDERIIKFKREIATKETERLKLEAAMQRITATPAADFISDMAAEKLQIIMAAIEQNEHILKVMDRAWELLNGYEFTKLQEMQMSYSYSINAGGSATTEF